MGLSIENASLELFNVGAALGSEEAGWSGTPVSLLINNTSGSLAANEGTIVEVTNDDGAGNLNSLQAVNSAQIATGVHQLSIAAIGDNIALGSSGSSAASGCGSTTSTGELGVVSNQMVY